MKKFILIILFLPSIAHAQTIVNFSGFESGVLTDASGIAGSPSVQSTTVHTGSFSLQMPVDGTAHRYVPVGEYDSGGVGQEGFPEDYITVGFHVYFTDITPTAAEDDFFCIRREGSTACHVQLTLESDGDLKVIDDSLTPRLTVTAPFTANTWHYLEFTVLIDASAGTGEIWVDGISKGTFSGADTLDSGDNSIQFSSFDSASDGTFYIDNYYVINDTVAAPTPLANNSDGLEVFAYQPGKSSAAADSGYTTNDSTLDTNTWAHVGHNPWSTTANNNNYSSLSAMDGAVVFDDVNNNGHWFGPNGGPHTVDGTIHGGKWYGLFDRGNGGATTWTFWYGSDSDTPLSNISMNDPNGDVLRGVVAEGAIVPTSSEYCAMGYGYSGAKGISGDEIQCEILHEPPAPAGGARRIFVISKGER